MKCTIQGQVLRIGEAEFEKKKYPFFEILQVGDERSSSEVVRVSGNGAKQGENITFAARVYVSDNGDLKVKKLDDIKGVSK